VRPGESGAAARLALIADGRRVLAQIHCVLLGKVGERGRKRLGLGRRALLRYSYFQAAQVDSGVTGREHFEHCLRHDAKGEQPTVALE
jgi:hypothetical protein